MSEYVFLEDHWEETKEFSDESARNTDNLPLAIDSFTAYLFRDASGKIVHRYPFSDQHYDVSFLRHYMQYITRDSVQDMPINQFKKFLMRMIESSLRKIASVRKQVSFLEIGSTLGENYRLIKLLVKELDLDLEVKFVGFEISSNLVQFSNLVNRGDPNFITIIGDASDLSRFPDRCFDFVINQGVANFCHDQKKAFSEIVRVARLAALVGVQMTLDENPFYLTRDIGYCTFLPTRAVLDEVWQPFAPLYDYHLATMNWTATSTSGSGSDRFIGVDPGSINSVFEYHLIARPNMFPEMEDLCRKIS